MGTYTTKLNLYKPDIGETNWGDLVNQNFDILDNSLVGNLPKCRVAHTYGMTIPPWTTVDVSFDEINFNIGLDIGLTTITIPPGAAGYYHIVFNATLYSDIRDIMFGGYINSSVKGILANKNIDISIEGGKGLTIETIEFLEENETLKFQVYHTDTSGHPLIGGRHLTYVCITKIA